MDSIMDILSNLKDNFGLKIDMYLDNFKLDNFKKEEFDEEYVMEQYINDISLEEELANDLLNF